MSSGRGILGSLSLHAYYRFKEAVKIRFGRGVSDLMTCMIAVNFHLPFYMTRTLPNVFALIGVLHAYAFWLGGETLKALSVLTAVTVVFRCDMLILLMPMTLQIIIMQEKPFASVAITGIMTGFFALVASIAIDSFFWQRWLWPEGIVLFFNTVENRSSDWGVMPW